MPLEGRGTGYSRLRAASEWFLSRLSRWLVARLVRRLGLQPSVNTVEHGVSVPRRDGRPARARCGSRSSPTSTQARPRIPSRLDEAARALREAEPDVLLLGGDYVYPAAEGIHELVAHLADIPAPLGRFAVFGNHDLWSRTTSPCARRSRPPDFRVLVNENVSLLRRSITSRSAVSTIPGSATPDAPAPPSAMLAT